MNLVSFSIKTKGAHNFVRRLGTVFTRFGFSEAPMRRALHVVTGALQQFDGVPTFFIPAVVLQRHPSLIQEIVRCGAEIGVHGYVHNDYRSLNEDEQQVQVGQAIEIFRRTCIPYQGFRNPYLGWTEEALRIFVALGFAYESNEAILHDVIELDHLPPAVRSGYEKSLALYRVSPCSAYTLRPHFERGLLRIPISVPDDEMLFDRLRITDGDEIGRIWSTIMQHIYDFGGLYTLNLHPERAVLCEKALAILLSFTQNRPLPVWVVCLSDVAQWWRERSQFRLHITPVASQCWHISAECTSRATLLARHLIVDTQLTTPWSGVDMSIDAHNCTVRATHCPCIGLSPHTPAEVSDFLQEHGYPVKRSSEEDASMYALYFDMPEGLGTTRKERMQRCSALVQQIEQVETPLIRFGCWPHRYRAALTISGDIDSVTIQDFFLRIFEVHHHV